MILQLQTLEHTADWLAGRLHLALVMRRRTEIRLTVAVLLSHVETLTKHPHLSPTLQCLSERTAACQKALRQYHTFLEPLGLLSSFVQNAMRISP